MTLARTLSRYARPRRQAAAEACELCAVPLSGPHRHMVDLERRTIACACTACALLFVERSAGNGKYRTIPDRVIVDPELVLDRSTWSLLEIPVGLAFVFFNSALERWVAFYPSPAGPTESELSLDAWSELAARSPLFGEIEPDVEALLVREKRGGGPLDCYLVPIDTCYELVGLVRKHWKGFDGGDARSMIDAFFDRLRARSARLRRSAS